LAKHSGDAIGMQSKPTILGRRALARTRLFQVEELHLRFSNGVERLYERLPATGHRAVITVAINAQNEVLLIREYAAGFHEYQLTLPKGSAEPGESLLEAANRELMEEAGFGARRLETLKELSVAPGHMGFTIMVVLAQDLFAERRPGDEPEELEVVPWPMAKLDELFARADFTEARAMAALYLARERLLANP
jgi:ADP-ribose diphosphatase